LPKQTWIEKAIGDDRSKGEIKISKTVGKSKSILVEGELDYRILRKFLPHEITIRAVGSKNEVLLRSEDYTLGIVDMDNDYNGQLLVNKLNIIDTNPFCCFFAAHIEDYHRILLDCGYEKSEVESMVELAKYLTKIRLFWSEKRPRVKSPIKMIQELDTKNERPKLIKEHISSIRPRGIFAYLCNLFIYEKLPELEQQMKELLVEFKNWENQNSVWLLNVGVNDHDIEFLVQSGGHFNKQYMVGLAKQREPLYSKIGKYI